jgi:Fic family protein
MKGRDDCVHLTPEIVLAIHRESIRRFGGSDGLRSRDLLESAVAAPQASFGGKSTFADLVEIAAAYLFYLCANHPFLDGNGRIGRAIAEKALAQNCGQPTLTALAYQIEKQRKAYYEALEAANKRNEITAWLRYFAGVVLQAQQTTQSRIQFLIEKTRLHDRLRGMLNPRQEKALERMFREGPEGFSGGLSAEKYLAITQTSRATATRDLAELVQLGALVRTGQLKGTRYWLHVPSISPNPAK